MLPPEQPDRIQIAFDDHRLVANAGLLLPVTLAGCLGCGELVDRHVDLGRAPGRANTGDKMLTLVASALAGGDCIDDADVLRNSFYARPKRMTPGSSAEPSGNGTTKAAQTDGDAGRLFARNPPGLHHRLRNNELKPRSSGRAGGVIHYPKTTHDGRLD